jgi:hypothetical protein
MVVAQYFMETQSVYTDPFIVIRNKRRFMSSEGFSALENNVMIFPLAVLPIQTGLTAHCRS